ncbi:YgdI/YgdR family lipoprotein [Limnobaculum zhutongyuii]|uniref:YgdI/YgdR family lipoprotein n=1 Tax=Limnobaculum zhutongyuii TaxID=2498113 RepID=A0A411WHV5_9GAMM|nr:YgdI/YgdR family lipoprotein [Limnobaculum zhutongyuii]QBH95624.1 YgdI/YgdR family lipoprotein [Limnobaculum zhutongyuii]TQS88684.1 YgdI/YgdR family lipoprotein [Limnobaculum zhutongyuii]
MKRFILASAALALTLGLAGCSSHYEMTMQDGTKVITVGEPQVDESTGMVTYETRFDGEKQIKQSEMKEYVKQQY